MTGTTTSPVRGCLMCDSLYVTANGQLPCWCDAGEKLVLKTIDPERLKARQENLFGFPELVKIRQSYLEGKDPFDVCLRCAVRGQGVATSLTPRYMRVLHVEPCYLCHLSCPQCIPATARRSLKDPPYHMDPEFFEALLAELRAEGVTGIRMVHFEGRGDPLMNVHTGEMVKAVKREFPGVFTVVTTHGNYPYKPWLLESGLDVIRFSVDGAFPGSYATYRVGGSLDKPLALMRRLRDEKLRTGSPLRVEWKYILFEWNDGDEEIRRAFALAEELDAHLSFCLTHTPGRSRRFPDEASLRGLRGRTPMQRATYQLRAGDEEAALEDLRGHHVASLFASARRALERGDLAAMREHVRAAIAIDRDVAPTEAPDAWSAGGAERIAEACSLGIVMGVAGLQVTQGQLAIADRLYERFVARQAENRDAELRRDSGWICGSVLQQALASFRNGDLRGADLTLGLAAAPVLAVSDPASVPAAVAARITDVLRGFDRAETIVALADLLHARGEPAAAATAYQRGLDVGLSSDEGEDLARTALVRCAIDLVGTGRTPDAESAVRAALAGYPGLPDGDALQGRLPALVTECQSPNLLAALANLALARRQPDVAQALFARYLEVWPEAPDREGVVAMMRQLRMQQALALALALEQGGDRAASDRLLDEALLLDAGRESASEETAPSALVRSDPAAVLGRISSPATAAAVASLMLARDEPGAVVAAFQRYLVLAPEAPDREAVRSLIAREDARSCERAAVAMAPASRGGAWGWTRRFLGGGR